MIGIVDYGMGNLHSVRNALSRLDIDHFLSENIEELERADGLLLPGVGSFRDAMNTLESNGMADFLKRWAAKGKPLMGICLGMQLLFEQSEENGLTRGLALLPGGVERFTGQSESGHSYKVPHMGWNHLTFHQPHSPILQGIEEGYVYFVHSYVVKTEEKEVLLATADYFGEVPAVVGRGNVFGTQFHPEKSSEVGVRMLTNFAKVVEGKMGK
jgi:glutamine amidotransferase